MAHSIPIVNQNASYTAQDLRRILDLLPAYGALGDGDGKVTQRGAGANMSVDVAAGTFLIPDATAARGRRLCRSDATDNVAIAAAPGAGTSRIDLITASATDTQFGDATDLWTVQAVLGTAAASPAVPATPAGAIALATVTVPAGAASITNFSLTDVRTFANPASRSQFCLKTTILASTALSTTNTAYAVASLDGAGGTSTPVARRPMIAIITWVGSVSVGSGGATTIGYVTPQISFDGGGTWTSGAEISAGTGNVFLPAAIAASLPVNAYPAASTAGTVQARILARRTNDVANLAGQLTLTTTPG
jgi:hypothetical protein